MGILHRFQATLEHGLIWQDPTLPQRNLITVTIPENYLGRLATPYNDDVQGDSTTDHGGEASTSCAWIRVGFTSEGSNHRSTWPSCAANLPMTGTDCPICGDSFTGETGIRDHTWDVHGACHYCSNQFDEKEALYTHWLEVHEDDLNQADRKRAENTVGDRTVCPVCTERFGSEASVRDHAWDTHAACHHCGDQFDDQKTLYTHWLAIHDDNLSRTDRKRAADEVGSLTVGDRFTHQGPAKALTGVRVGRRTFIGGSVAGLIALIGGAVAGDIFEGNGSSGVSLKNHPATTALESQPRLGPAPTDAKGTIVAFEDPSCPSCARFELGTFPKLKSQLIDAGTVSFIYRGIPVVQSWGDPAVMALETTYARDEAAFWALKEFYYRSQEQLGDQNVRAMTRRFLSEETAVDAEAVLEDVDTESYRDAVTTDLQAAQDADVGGTPTFYLFKSGSYVTDIVGAQSYEVFKNSLGV